MVDGNSAVLVQYKLAGYAVEFYYQFLARLLSDCKYFLGAGNRYNGVLWAHEPTAQLRIMRAIYAILPEKPEWTSLDQINRIEAAMVGHN